MKRRLIIAAVALAVAVAAVVFFVVRDENPHFGYADEVFVLPSEVKIELEGDTHLVTGDTLKIYVGSEVAGSISLRSLNGREFVRGPSRVRAEDPPEYGYIEKLVDGEWEFYSDLYSIYSSSTFTRTRTYSLLDGRDFHFVLPLHDAGEYRVTEYFREQFETEDGGVSRSDERYSVSYRFTVHEPSGKKFDVLAMDIHSTYIQSADMIGQQLTLALKANDGVPPYIDCDYIELEMYDGLEWVDVAEPEDAERYTGYNSRYSRDAFWPYAFYTEAEGSYDEPTAAVFHSGYFYPEDEGALQRVTLRFTENEDGSGEEYFLTLKFRWDFEE